MKRWPHYDVLERKLKQAGFNVVYLRQRKKLADYVKDINKCDISVSGTRSRCICVRARKADGFNLNVYESGEVYDYGRIKNSVAAS